MDLIQTSKIQKWKYENEYIRKCQNNFKISYSRKYTDVKIQCEQ